VAEERAACVRNCVTVRAWQSFKQPKPFNTHTHLEGLLLLLRAPARIGRGERDDGRRVGRYIRAAVGVQAQALRAFHVIAAIVEL
jgi:hypothetical protein